MSAENPTPAEQALSLLAQQGEAIIGEFQLDQFNVGIVGEDADDILEETLKIECTGFDCTAMNQALGHCESILVDYKARHLRSGIVPARLQDGLVGWYASLQVAIDK